MNNIWVKCELIEWASDDTTLPKSIEAFCIAPEYLNENEDNFDAALSDAIDEELTIYYGVIGHCICFSQYDDKDCATLDLQLLLGACHK